jgi:glucokinase
VADAIADAAREAAEKAGTKTEDLKGIGVGSPGAIDPEKGTVSGAGNLPDWDGSYALAKELKKRLGVKVALGNDVSVATAAEFRLGAGREFESIQGVFWGTGVGGGIVLDGREWHGRGSAAEIGHVVVKKNGALCPCGRRGCMEAYAGRGAMEARAREMADEGEKTVLFKIMEERGKPRLTSGIWARALDQGDKLAEHLIDRAIEAIGVATASTQNILDVEAIIIGGGLGTRLGEPYVERIAKAMEPHLFVVDRPPEIRLAALGDFGGALGAALLVS